MKDSGFYDYLTLKEDALLLAWTGVSNRTEGGTIWTYNDDVIQIDYALDFSAFKISEKRGRRKIMVDPHNLPTTSKVGIHILKTVLEIDGGILK